MAIPGIAKFPIIIVTFLRVYMGIKQAHMRKKYEKNLGNLSHAYWPIPKLTNLPNKVGTKLSNRMMDKVKSFNAMYKDKLKKKREVKVV